MSTTNVLITGTKSGIGHGLLAAFAARPNTNIIAAIRDPPTSPKAKAMITSVPTVAKGSNIIPVEYDAASPTAAHNLIKSVQASHPDIKHLDIVVANAAINTQWGPSHTVTAKELNDQLAVNTMAPIFLYQATRDLLLASEHTPKFFLMSTTLASMGAGARIPFPTVVYGMSKAAGNYFAVKTNLEEDRLVIVPVHPGWVQTDLGNDLAMRSGGTAAPMTVQQSVDGLMKLFDGATKEIGGTFQQVGGDMIPW
ncbi:hypothetical protein PMZ80_007366 [Knufia obscura]|uniref:Uncharacterized protein n=2 Tax=Knufia TaxID=430999 RepID=A0AAN8EGW8_9EURO|nr:hypothetical protein PMZ80_007366 [Knufia obscura]KAK5950547.1 hypothetical protein OHC33_008490 [Knufia fluminis]